MSEEEGTAHAVADRRRTAGPGLPAGAQPNGFSKGENATRRTLRPATLSWLVALLCAVAALAFASTALADSPHYVKGPTVTVGTNSLTVSWKAAGLGNTTTSVDFTLTGTVTSSSQCFTKSGNPVNGVPKSETIDVNASGTFPVRNGQTTGSFTVSPLSTLTCTGNQHVVILSVSYDLFLNGNSLPEVHLTG